MSSRIVQKRPRRESPLNARNMNFSTVQKSITNRRLLSELAELLKNPIAGCDASPKDDDVKVWTAVIEGPTGSPYEGGIFFAELHFTEEYPYVAPSIVFLSRIYHCNIENSGRTYLELIETGWNPCRTVADILLSLTSLLRSPLPAKALVPKIAKQFLNEPQQFDNVARQWTQRYAR